jgi:hypothetical protein
LKSPEILSVSLASWRYTSEGIRASYVLNLSIWGVEVGAGEAGGPGEAEGAGEEELITNVQCSMPNN